MNWNAETQRGKTLAVAALFFLVSLFVVFTEFLYIVDSREGTAEITQIYKVEQRAWFVITTSQRLRVDYEFIDADRNSRSGRDHVAIDWPIPRDGKIKIRYRPGPDGSSRFAGHVNWIPVVFFLICLVAIGVFSYRLWKEANAAYANPSSKKR